MKNNLTFTATIKKLARLSTCDFKNTNVKLYKCLSSSYKVIKVDSSNSYTCVTSMWLLNWDLILVKL